MVGCSEKTPTNNRWPREALILEDVPAAEVESIYDHLNEINFATNLVYFKIFKNKSSPPKNKVENIIEKIKIEYMAYLEEQMENTVLYSTPGKIITI